LLPVDRSGQRVIDGERVCQTIAAISPAVAAESDGRVIRYPFAEGPVAALLTR
jgi:hypothetical protein